MPKPKRLNPKQAALQRIRKRVETGWCKGSAAVDARGHSCSPISPRAVRWCLTGAMAREGYGSDAAVPYATRTVMSLAARHLYDALLEKDPDFASLVVYNDNHKQADVLRLINRAIELAEGRSL